MFDKKTILVYAAGSLGCYLAAKLYSAGHKVEVVGHKKAQDIGKTLYINDEAFEFPPVFSELDPMKSYDYIFVTSKYYDLKRNLETVVNSGVRTGMIVLIQNTYIDNTWYFKIIKNVPFTVISVFEGFNLEENKLGCKSYAGWFLEEDMLSRDVNTLLKGAKLQLRFTDDIDVKRAEKTVINCATNALSAIEGKKIKDLFKNKENVKTMQSVFDETYDVLSEVIPMHSKRSQWAFFLTTMRVLDHYASTYQDVVRNKRTEVSFLNGFIVELGRKIGIPTPYNLELIKRFQEKYPDLY